jgi:hypothetical protein
MCRITTNLHNFLPVHFHKRVDLIDGGGGRGVGKEFSMASHHATLSPPDSHSSPRGIGTECTAKNQYRKFEKNIPRKGISRPHFHFHEPVSDLYIPRSASSAAGNMWTDPRNI